MDIKNTLKENNFKFEKKFGQNFLTDSNLLNAIVNDCDIEKKDNVLEIGPGAGALTKFIAEKANKVLCYEIDTNLQPILSTNLKNQTNIEIIFKDIMTIPNNEISKKLGSNYSIIANLPYYITTPIIFKFLNDDNVKQMCIMVQKEVAERIVAKSGKDYGILSIMVDFCASAQIKRIVNRNMFTPAPNVDSAIVLITKKKKLNCDYNLFEKIVQTAFSMRRKTLVNNLSSGLNLTKSEAENLIFPLGKNIRGENLSTNDYVQLTNKYEILLKNNK